jgi:hypothetical protein
MAEDTRKQLLADVTALMRKIEARVKRWQQNRQTCESPKTSTPRLTDPAGKFECIAYCSPKSLIARVK